MTQINYDAFNKIRTVIEEGGLIVGEEKTLTEDEKERINELLGEIEQKAAILKESFDKARQRWKNK